MRQTASKDDQRMMRAGERFWSVLLTLALVLQTSPVAARAESVTTGRASSAPAAEQGDSAGDAASSVAERGGSAPDDAHADEVPSGAIASQPEEAEGVGDDADSPSGKDAERATETEDGAEALMSDSGSAADGRDAQGDSEAAARATETPIRRTYIYEDDQLVATAKLEKATAIPDDAELQVCILAADAGDQASQAQYAAYLQALNDACGATAERPRYTSRNTLLLDVAFVRVDPATGELEELQLAEGSVKIKLHFKQRQLSRYLDLSRAADASVFHLPMADGPAAGTDAQTTDATSRDVLVEPLVGDGFRGVAKNTVEVVTHSLSAFAVANPELASVAPIALTTCLYGESDRVVGFRMTPADEAFNKLEGVELDVAPDDEGVFPYGEKSAFRLDATLHPQGTSDEAQRIDLPVRLTSAGTYWYVIEQVATDDGLLVDDARIDVTVTVEEVGDEPQVTYAVLDPDGGAVTLEDGALACLYDNEMVRLGFRSAVLKQSSGVQRETAFEPKIRKVLVNGTVEAGEFTFALYAGTDTSVEPLDTATNDEHGMVTFDARRYDDVTGVDEEGIPSPHVYTIVELAGGKTAYAYSSEQIRLEVTVDEVGTGEATRLEATGEYHWNDLAGEPCTYRTDAAGEGEDASLPTLYNNFVETVGIHAVKRERTSGKGATSLGKPLTGAVYELFMANSDGNDISMGTSTSDAGGNLHFEIPPAEGVVYYLREKKAPAGYLIDPYPTDYFTLVLVKEKGEDGTIVDVAFELRYESDTDATGKPLYESTNDFISAVENGEL